MAKDKTKVTAGEAEQTKIVLKYLKEKNRPYNAVDVVTNLKGAITKPQAQKAWKKEFEILYAYIYCFPLSSCWGLYQ